jgi:hypothetical protein
MINIYLNFTKLDKNIYFISLFTHLDKNKKHPILKKPKNMHE